MGNTYSRYINPSRNRVNPIGEYGLGREILERIEQYRVVEQENQEKLIVHIYHIHFKNWRSRRIETNYQVV